MIKNTLMKFIDSCVGNIARKIEDEFRESDHPRDKGGKFTSKGGEGREAGKKGNVVTTSMEFTGDEEDAKQLAKKYGFDYKLKYPKGSPYATIELTGDKDALRKYAINEGFGSEEDAREFVPELFEGEESEDDDEYEEGRGGERDPHHEASVEETDDIMQRVSDTGIDVEEFMADLGINTSRIPEDRLEETLSEELYADPNLRDKALKELKNYAGE